MAKGYYRIGLLHLTLVFLTIQVNLISSLSDIFSRQAFVSIWNAPTKVCETKYGIVLNLSNFDIIANTNDTFEGNDIVIFYKDRLGMYPWITEDGQYVNGGLPQLSNVTAHLQQVERDINRFIPNNNFCGVAVIDWEEWRPIFDRNKYNEKQKIYVQASMEVVRKKHPDWSDQRIESEARFEFESAANEFMKSTLELCKQLRLGGNWGFYGFPRCYNYMPGEKHCTNHTRSENDRLDWLFKSTTVLEPSVYIRQSFGSHEDRYNEVYGTLEETLRVKQKYGGVYTPMILYTRFRYGDTGRFYDLIDLNSTIGQSADTGFSGISLWDSSFSFRSASDCEQLQVYLDSTLGPFVINVTREAKRCSQSQCNSNGRCFKDYKSYREEQVASSLTDLVIKVFRTLLRYFLDLLWYTKQQDGIDDAYHETNKVQNTYFQCFCFKGWSGENCQHRTL